MTGVQTCALPISIISDRDFVIGTVVAPTILVEPEKTEEATTEGEVPAEDAVEGGAEGTVTAEEDGKDKTAKPSDDKSKDAPSKKEQPSGKETKKK